MGCEFTPERPEPFFVPHSANMRNPADPRYILLLCVHHTQPLYLCINQKLAQRVMLHTMLLLHYVTIVVHYINSINGCYSVYVQKVSCAGLLPLFQNKSVIYKQNPKLHLK